MKSSLPLILQHIKVFSEEHTPANVPDSLFSVYWLADFEGGPTEAAAKALIYVAEHLELQTDGLIQFDLKGVGQIECGPVAEALQQLRESYVKQPLYIGGDGNRPTSMLDHVNNALTAGGDTGGPQL